MRFGPISGVRLLATASCRPGDLLGPAHRLDDAAAWRALLGEGWADELRARGLDADHPERAWGVASRDWCALPGRAPAADAVDLGVAAARTALERASVEPGEVDVLVLASSTPTRPTASDAHRAATRLGVRGAAWDLRSGGAAGLLGWVQGAQAVAAGARAALVVAAEVVSPYLDPDDPTCLLYGDAAVALVLGPGGAHGLRCARAGHVAAAGVPFTVPAALPPLPGERFRVARPDATYLGVLERVWADAGAALAADLDGPADALLPYAVTRRQVRALADAVPARRVVDVLRDHGAVGAVGPLVALDAWWRETGGAGVVAAAAVGGGVSWATLVWETR